MGMPALPPLPHTIAMRTGADFAPDAHGAEPQWHAAPPACFDRSDWGAGPPRPDQSTCARILWTPGFFYLRFDCRYRTLTVFPPSSAAAGGRRLGVWNRDIVEAFIQPHPSTPDFYKEMDISPNGLWIDLSIDHRLMRSKGSPPLTSAEQAAASAEHEKLRQWRSGALHSVAVNEAHKIWRAEWAIPMPALMGSGSKPEAGQIWRIGMFRQEGLPKETFEWSPTGPPSFHVPERFGYLVLRQPMSFPQKPA